jgi:polar amino acid transport system substrate-binding protein
MEIAAMLAEYLGKELVIQNMDFDSVCLAVGQQKCDIAMAGLTINEERKEYVTFTDSYYNASQVVICLESDTIFDACKTGEEVAKILGELDASKKVGCQKGTTGELYIKGDDSDGGYGFPGLKAECATYDYAALAVTAMKQGQVNYVICDNGPAKAIAAKLNG